MSPQIIIFARLILNNMYRQKGNPVYLFSIVLVAVIGKIRPSTVAEQFVKGCSNLLWAALIMTIVSGVEYIVKNRQVFSQ